MKNKKSKTIIIFRNIQLTRHFDSQSPPINNNTICVTKSISYRAPEATHRPPRTHKQKKVKKKWIRLFLADRRQYRPRPIVNGNRLKSRRSKDEDRRSANVLLATLDECLGGWLANNKPNARHTDTDSERERDTQNAPCSNSRSNWS